MRVKEIRVDWNVRLYRHIKSFGNDGRTARATTDSGGNDRKKGKGKGKGNRRSFDSLRSLRMTDFLCLGMTEREAKARATTKATADTGRLGRSVGFSVWKILFYK
jgi:hypothetical protein